MNYFNNCPFDVTPYEKSNLVKNPPLTNLNYTNLEYWSLKARLIDFIKEKFGESFNDFVESDLALMLIENWAFIADTLHFKIDQVANEIFIDTVTQVDNAFRLAQLVGFKPQPPIGARSMWSATISNVLNTDLVINTPVVIEFTSEEGTKTIELFQADSNQEPVFDQPILISAGSFLNTSVIGLEGRTVVQQFVGNGDTNQSFLLNFSPVIWNSVRVTVDGVQWTEVAYFTDSQPRREFRVEYDSDFRVFVIFGNSRAGMIPSGGSIIQVEYRTGGGVVGNIVTGSLEVQRNFLVSGFDFRVPVTFRNYTRGEFGYSGDTIVEVKQKLPNWLRTQNRAVTGSDYETLADQFVTEYHGQIGKSKAILRQHGCAANIIDLYILALDGEDGLKEASSGLKTKLQDYLAEKKMITDAVCIKDGVVLEVDIYLDLQMDKFYRKFEEEIKERVERRVLGFFDLNNWDFGKILKSQDMIKQLSDINEITSFDATFVSDAETGITILAKFYEVIRPGTISLNFIYD